MTHKFAKLLILAIGALGLSALPALADNACSTYDGSDNGATYTAAGFSCYITGSNGITLDFSDFTYNSENTGVPNASGVTVTPVTSPDGPGFVFNAGWLDSGTSNGDVDITFDVTAEGGAEIDDIYITLSASSYSGTGSVLYEETYCLDESNPPCFEQVENPSTAPQTDLVTLPNPVTSLSIDKDVTLAVGSDGTAGLSNFGNNYSTIPEPRAVSLVLGLGLLAGFAFFKRRRAAQN